jgi:ABC-2 type transport system ATP-binding protein
VTRAGQDELRVRGVPAAAVGHAAFAAGIELHELRTERADLEQLFFQLTEGQFAAPGSGQVPPPNGGPGGPAGAPPGAPPGQIPSAPAPGGVR